MASSIKRNAVYNLGGNIFSVFVSLITVPLYLHAIGDARYGVLTIVWLFTGYFGVFDLGLSRAVAYHIAKLHDAPPNDIASTFWTAVWLNLGFGFIGAVILYAIAMPVFTYAFHMQQNLRTEIIASMPWICASLPLATLSGVLVGALQGRERFALINTIGATNTTLTQLIPLGVALWYGPDLAWLIPAVVIARFVGIIPLLVAVWRGLPLVRAPLFAGNKVRGLFVYGGWVTVSNVVSPILTTLDRMIIGILLNAQAVAFYAVPLSLVSRLQILPTALSSGLFPRMASSSQEVSDQLAQRSVIALSAVLTIFAVVGMVALPLFLQVWISPAFAHHAAVTGMILMMGAWINGIAFIPHGLLQAQNRPDLTAKFHLVELVPFLLVLWGGIHWFGLEGAAMAWTLRVGSDAALLFYATRQISIFRSLVIPAGLIALSAFIAPTDLLSKNTFLGIAMIILSIIWAMLSAGELRKFMLCKLTRKASAPL